MDETGQFTRLAQGLSLEERESLLHRLEGQSLLSKEPLYDEPVEPAAGDIEVRYAKLPWYRRLLFFFLSIFKGQTPVKLFQDSEITKLAKEIELSAPGFYNAARGILLPDFYNAVVKLRDSSRFFYNALDAGFNRDKGGFFVFLGSLEMPDIHARLVEETTPERIAEKNPGIAESVLRQTAMKMLEEIIGIIPEEDRLKMYNNTRSLTCLKQLSSFLYDRLLLAFINDEASGGMICSVGIIRDALISLNNILYSLKEIPSMPLLSSLFVFILQDQVGADGFDINLETERLLTQAEGAIAAIRAFNRQAPLTRIVRVSARDTGFFPQPLSGGEDWFQVYRDRWRKDVDDGLFRFFSQRRRRELQNTYRDFFGGAPLFNLESMESPEHPDGMSVPGMESLCFLLSFVRLVFMRTLNPVLQKILTGGEFRRPDNRLEYDEACTGIIRLDETIQKFDETLGPKGEWGKRAAQINTELTTLPAKRRKLQLLMEECTEAARGIIDRANWALNILVNVLKGLTGTDAGERYKGLSNMEKLEAKNPGFTGSLAGTAEKLQRAREILAEVEFLEAGRDE
jgi:hypothetical protein